jgi:GxxExxY protein
MSETEKIINIEVAHDELSRQIVDSVFYVHQNLGAGLLESAYEECLALVFLKRNIPFTRQILMPIEFDGNIVPNAYKLDMIVDNRIILELKAVEKTLPVHEAQILTYLKLTKMNTGFLINFNTRLIKDGIKRYRL